MYVPLNIKTDNYLQSSMIKISDLIQFALDNNITSLTITDNNMYGVIDFYKACKDNNIKPIIGLEVIIDSLIVILYAKDYEGYLNLVKLSTMMSSKELSTLDIINYNSKLICILPYESRQLYDKLSNVFVDIFLSYKNKFSII